MKEFELIKRFFTEQVIKRKDVVLGIGDDCAIVSPSERQNIAITTDTLVAGVHFPHETSAQAIGHKAIAVNLSDLAAMGAEPAWISLAITMPEVDLKWVEGFCRGAFELCEYYNVQLIGGDTTQGPLAITVTAQGLIPMNKHLTRSGAKAGDWVYVTGEIGDAALALKDVFNEINLATEYRESVRRRLDYPTPRVLAGQALREYASAAIDLSDGIISDLGHICRASQVGANIVLDDLPISNALRDTVSLEEAFEMALVGGDDYELLFTVSEDNKVGMETALANSGNTITCIGQLNRSEKITTTLNSKAIAINAKSFEHFASSKK